MKRIYLDLNMGAAGDMLNAALYELLDEDKKKEYIETVNSLIPEVSVTPVGCNRNGITGIHMDVAVKGVHEGEEHHGHHHHHHHRHVSDIQGIVEGFPLDSRIRGKIMKVYDIVAEAESHAHGVDVTEVHFHEVGALDAVIDISGACILMDMLGSPKVTASPVALGGGTVKCAHGVLPVPAPATAYIVEGMPVHGGPVDSELLTPTGAALLKTFVSEYTAIPHMSIEKTGYGIGAKEFPDHANILRVFAGETADTAIELSCNIDDMTGEEIAFAAEEMLREGAYDCWYTQIQMKKGRPGVTLSVLCGIDEEDRFTKLMFRHTTTIGIRKFVCDRDVLKREEYMKDGMRVKRSYGHDVIREKTEYEDRAKYARENNIPLKEV